MKVEFQVALVPLFFLCCSAMSLDLQKVASRLDRLYDQKRAKGVYSGGNQCKNKDNPFPCRTPGQCIPIGYLCDDNPDCDDSLDEDKDLCTAMKRPGYEDLRNFLAGQGSWMLDSLFGGRNEILVAHALTVADGVKDLQRRLDLSDSDGKKIDKVFSAIKNDKTKALYRMGMPKSSSTEGVKHYIVGILDTGFKL